MGTIYLSFNFFSQKTLHLLLGLLASDPINDWVEGRQDDYIEISQEDMDILRDVMTKAMSEEGEKSWAKEGQDNTDMGATCVESLQASIVRREVENSI